MAFLNATVWNDWQDTFAKSDQRFGEHGVINLFKDSTPLVDYISPATIEKFNTFSSARGIQIPVIKEQTVTVVTTPGFNFIPDNLTESDQYTFVAVDFFSGLRHYPALYENNTIGAEFDLNVKMTNIADAMATAIEQNLVTVLEANKTQVLEFTEQLNHSSGNGTYTFNTTPDVLEINEAAQQETVFSSLNEVMKANKLGGIYASVASPAGFAVQKMEALKFGEANTKDIRALGMIPASDMHTTFEISAGSDIFNGFWVRKGSVGIYENFPFDFRMGTSIGDKEKWSISDVEIGATRMRANIYTNSFATNAGALVTSADSNLTMTSGEEMAIWIRYYAVFPYNTDIATRPNPIVKLSGKTT